MQTLRGRLAEWLGHPRALALGLVALLVAIAYRGLWTRPGHVDVESIVFDPASFPGQAIPLLAAWLLWRRRGALHSAPRECASPAAAGLAGVGVGLYAWSLWMDAPDLLWPSLSLHGLALAACRRGLAGCRIVALPALVLLFGMAVPKPLEDEIIWRLQLWTADGAGLALDVLGRSFIQSGVILRDAEHTFHVIDSCSGWNGIGLLLAAALIVRELFAEAGARMWLLIPLALPVAFVSNVVRVAYVAASPNPEALAGVEGDHTMQGIVVVVAGTLLLYAIGVALSATHAGGPRQAGPDATPRTPWSRAILGLAGGWAVLLVCLSILLPRPVEPRPGSARPAPALPEAHAGWRSEAAPRDDFFSGRIRASLHRRYVRPLGPRQAPEIVDVLIAYALPDVASVSRLFSSKSWVPGPEWNRIAVRRERLWRLDAREAVLSISARPSGERALTYAWSIRDTGVFRESLRILLGLQHASSERDAPRTIVRLVAYAPHDGRLVIDHAKQRLDRFIDAFADELRRL